MKVSYPVHVQQTRQVELGQSDLANLQELMMQLLLFYAEYHDFCSSSYPSPFEGLACELCEKCGVDINTKKERLAFFKSLVSALRESDRPLG